MDIKTFDIVEVNGIPGRVMYAPDRFGTVKVSGLGEVELSTVELVESVTIPTFEVGDEVIIDSIPVEEQNSYTYGWNGSMALMMKQSYQNGTVYTVTKVGSSSENNGLYYALDDKYVFAPYHLKKVIDYDFI